MTINTLENHIDDETWKREFEPQLRTVKKQSKFARNLRNESIAHTDYSVATGSALLNPELVKDVSELIESIGKLLLTIYDHYFEGGWSFDYWLTHEDEFNVLHHLFEAQRQRNENVATYLSDLSEGLPVTVPLLDTTDYPDWIQRPKRD